MIVREQTIADAEEIQSIVRLATAELRRIYKPIESLRGGVPQKSILADGILVASQNGCLLGVVEYLDRKEDFYIQGLAVHPDFRRRGVARALIKAIEDRGLMAGRDTLSLCTIKEAGNLPVFVRLGFVLVTENVADGFVSPEGKSVSRITMERAL